MATTPVAISCDECSLEETGACDDCLVSFLLGPPSGEAVIVDVMEERAIHLLHEAGLLPEIRFARKAG